MDNEEKQKIINTAAEVFVDKGFLKTPVDDVASALKMSKKTIYKHFPSKDSLVKAVVYFFLNLHSGNIKKIIEDNSLDAVTKFFRVMRYLTNFILKAGNSVMNMQAKYPSLWKQIDNFRVKVMYTNLTSIIQQGQKEGLFVDKPADLIVTLFIAAVRSIVNPDYMLHSKRPIGEVIPITLEILMNGIMTEKGKQKFASLNSGENK